jgi:hypothetical protein
MSLYLESCRYNPSIDFLIFTDCGAPDISCPNVTMIKSTLEQFHARASEKLGHRIFFEDTYKLCDFKPAFGVIFEEYLGAYDFWGNADIDIIYGNIRNFLTDELLERNDVISARKEYLAGHMTLYRNCPDINRLYEKSADYPRVFLDPQHFSFCECSKLWHHLQKGRSIFDNMEKQARRRGISIIESMTHIVTRLRNADRLRASFTTMIKDRPELRKKKWKLRWKQGCLFDTDTEEQFLYFHMIGLKEEPDFQIPQWEDVPEQFYITRNGFSIYRGFTEKLVRRLRDRLSRSIAWRKPGQRCG